MSELLKAAPIDPNVPYPMDALKTGEVKAWIRMRAAAQVFADTALLYDHYLREQFAGWLIGYQNYTAAEPPPGVPDGFDAMLADDGFSYTRVSSEQPAGPIPDYPRRSTPIPSGSIKSAAPAVGGLLFAAVGATATQLDGTVWRRVS